MWHPLQADFPQQRPQPDFIRGPLSVAAGEPVGLLRYGGGCVAPILNPMANWPEWLDADQYDPERHAALVVVGRWQGLAVLVQSVRASQARQEQWPSLRQWLLQSDAGTFDLLVTAAGLASWQEQHRYCGRCGTRTRARQDEYAQECPRCRLRQYPRVSPCVITLVWRDDALLLARSPRFAPGVYSTLAGFIEAGESAEQALHREIMEEVGVEVGNFRYLGSQFWPFPHSLMLGYWAEYQGGSIRVDGQEIEDAQWYPFDRLPSLPPQMAISRYLIDSFLQWKGIRP